LFCKKTDVGTITPFTGSPIQRPSSLREGSALVNTRHAWRRGLWSQRQRMRFHVSHDVAAPGKTSEVVSGSVMLMSIPVSSEEGEEEEIVVAAALVLLVLFLDHSGTSGTSSQRCNCASAFCSSTLMAREYSKHSEVRRSWGSSTAERPRWVAQSSSSASAFCAVRIAHWDATDCRVSHPSEPFDAFVSGDERNGKVWMTPRTLVLHWPGLSSLSENVDGARAPLGNTTSSSRRNPVRTNGTATKSKFDANASDNALARKPACVMSRSESPMATDEMNPCMVGNDDCAMAHVTWGSGQGMWWKVGEHRNGGGGSNNAAGTGRNSKKRKKERRHKNRKTKGEENREKESERGARGARGRRETRRDGRDERDERETARNTT
jgi:hypothetical protein